VSSERHRRAKAIFVEACERPADRRAEFLGQACGDDEDLRREVESLLRFHEETALRSQGAPPAATPTTPLVRSAATEERVRDYRLLRRIGEGGMGVVYEAEQLRPVHRRVALKVIKAGMDTEQVVARFETERQALALMDHPNIARVYDAGRTESGRPFFAMEYISGEPLTTYCDRHRLSTRERLQLFRQICDGVQHAHQKGVIHRDIKPSNVLVRMLDDRPAPTIIDFGIAKATGERPTEKTMYTELGMLIGTPEYMSPEQAEQTPLDVDTRSDVYSLGVMLYELLAGVLPFESGALRSASLDEIRRMIREDEPSKPSTRVTTLGEGSTEKAGQRRTDLPGLRRQLRGDLDWITMKALEKDRARRYGSARELAEDLARHLRHEPVLAGPPGVAYRLGKFVRRHRVGVGVAAALLVVLVGFTVTTAIQSRRIAREARTSERVSSFLADMLAGLDPEEMGGLLLGDLRERMVVVARERGATEEQIEEALAWLRDVEASDAALRFLDDGVLAPAGTTVRRQFETEPLIAARLETTIGWTYFHLGLYERSEPHLLRSLELRRRLLGDDHPDTLYTVNELANLYTYQDRPDEAGPLYVETLGTRRRVLGRDHPETLASLNNLAMFHAAQGRFADAEVLFRETVERRERVLGEDHPDTTLTVHYFACMLREAGKYEQARPLFARVRRAWEGRLDPGHRFMVENLTQFAMVLRELGEEEEAARLEALVRQSARD
jgi:non-specific serine/threonine protein kinase/serine/threonine-protein kinase